MSISESDAMEIIARLHNSRGAAPSPAKVTSPRSAMQ
jgi:hypothetical protein